MTNIVIAEDGLLKGALSSWQLWVGRADKLFSGLSPEQLQKEIAPGKNRLIYLWGHLTAIHDAMLPLLGFGARVHPELDAVFVSKPDRSVPDMPSAEAMKKNWNEVNEKLRDGFAKLSPAEWLEKHSAVSEEDFAKDPSRNRFAILLSRTNHVAYHYGQAVQATK